MEKETQAMTTRAEAGFRRNHGSPSEVLRDVSATLATWAERRRQRRQLQRLDDRLLADIGLDRARADYEANKPFWKD